jgi:hypothetical protein
MTDASFAPPISRLGGWCLLVGTSLIVLFAATFATGFVGLMFDVRVGWWVLIPAIAAQVGFTVLAAARVPTESDPARQAPTVLAVVAVGWVVIVAAGLASQLVSDTSVDGRHYQSETTRAVARGWNPVRQGPLFPSDRPYQPDATPKSSAIVGATVLRITNSIEATRLVGAVLLIAAAAIAIAGLEGAGAKRWLAIIGGLTLSLNPVALAQLGTAMVDGIVSSLLLATVLLSLLWIWRHPPILVLPPLAGGLVLLVNTKFTGLVYVGLIIIPVIVVAGLVAHVGRRLLAMLGAVVACTLLAVLVLGYNPYVTNLLRHEHPLHPLYGPDSLDIGAQYRTGEFTDKSEPERLFLSVFSASATGTAEPERKTPFRFDTSEWSAFRSPGVRIGGFGPWFSGGLLLALAAFLGSVVALLIGKARIGKAGVSPQAYALVSVAGICLVATLVQPSAFLARFAPQLWFVPTLLAIAVLLVVGTRLLQAIAWLALGVLMVNALGVAGATAVWDVRDTDREKTSLDRLRALSPLQANFSSWRQSEARRLREHGIRFVAVDRVVCPIPFVLSVAGGLTKQPKLYGVPPPPGGVQLCPLPIEPAPG